MKPATATPAAATPPAGAPATLDGELVRAALRAAGAERPVERLAAALAVPSERFVELAAEYFDLRPLTMAQLRASTPDFSLISFVEATQRLCAAVTAPDGTKLVVLTDPMDARTRAWAVQRLRARRVFAGWALAATEDLRAWLALAEKSLRAMDSVGVAAASAAANDSAALSLSIAQISAAESPIVRLVDSTIHDALKSEASDIHLETQRTGLVIKYRIDGVLGVVKRVEGLDTAHQVLSRVKVIAELDIAERRVPQDGRFKVAVDGREIDLRVSIMPNLFGEDAVLRILDRRHLSGEANQIRLDSLGFDPATLDFIRRMAGLPYGLLLVTGPTGSGKTTTLYAALSEINTGLDKIVTIEDPVEYQVADILQIPVNEKKGLTFARGLRSILRHDPDKIMVGEIRDPETAQIAVQAALTGHLVFTTVHANNVFDVIGRFVNMGVDTYSFVSALNGILAQRLVRLVCPRCAKPVKPKYEVLAAARIQVPTLHRAAFRRGLGCAHCRGTGYKGRRAIAETLVLNDDLRDLLAERAPLSRIKAAAQAAGYRSLREAAVAAAVAGATTIEEINRVTPVE
jgi:general secretion pathway protein E